jgi:hypothetical protein
MRAFKHRGLIELIGSFRGHACSCRPLCRPRCNQHPLSRYPPFHISERWPALQALLRLLAKTPSKNAGWRRLEGGSAIFGGREWTTRLRDASLGPHPSILRCDSSASSHRRDGDRSSCSVDPGTRGRCAPVPRMRPHPAAALSKGIKKRTHSGRASLRGLWWCYILVGCCCLSP